MSLLEDLKPVHITKINSLEYSYSQGYAMYSRIRFFLKLIDGKIIASYKPYGVPDEKKLEKEVDESFREQIESALKEFKVNKWNGFQKYNKNVLDGDSFDLYISMEGDNSIHAYGYMKWPNNYREFREKINEIYLGIFKEETENLELIEC